MSLSAPRCRSNATARGWTIVPLATSTRTLSAAKNSPPSSLPPAAARGSCGDLAVPSSTQDGGVPPPRTCESAARARTGCARSAARSSLFKASCGTFVVSAHAGRSVMKRPSRSKESTSSAPEDEPRAPRPFACHGTSNASADSAYILSLRRELSPDCARPRVRPASSIVECHADERLSSLDPGPDGAPGAALMGCLSLFSRWCRSDHVLSEEL